MTQTKEILSKKVLEHAIDDAVSIVTRNLSKWKEKIPISADAGVYRPVDISSLKVMGVGLNWAAGCGPGIYWLCYAYTDDPLFKEAALKIVERFKGLKHVRSQCQGILYMPLCVPAYRLCNSQTAKQILLNGADVLYSMYEPEHKYFRAWGDIKNFSVDSIINIALMHWATDITGDRMYYDAAIEHIRTEIDEMILPDGSTYDLVDTDNRGNIIDIGSNHINNPHGCWSRGHAWAMYGFAMHYKFTGNEEYLNCFKKLSSFFYDNLTDNMIPCHDLKLKNTLAAVDTSAAAIAVCATLEMSSLLPGDSKIASFKHKADAVMLSLIKNYSVAYDNYIDALILGGTNNRKSGWYDEALIFGDYFYLEALVRYLTDGYVSCWQ